MDVVGCGGGGVVVVVVDELDTAVASTEAEEQLTVSRAIATAIARARHRCITGLSRKTSSQTEMNQSRPQTPGAEPATSAPTGADMSGTFMCDAMIRVVLHAPFGR